MIATNYRKFAAAAAVQGVLAFGRPVWALSRPSTRALRAIRAARAKLINSREQLVTWCKSVTPQWVKDAMKKAKALAAAWKAAQMELPFLDESGKVTTTTEKEPTSVESLMEMHREKVMTSKTHAFYRPRLANEHSFQEWGFNHVGMWRASPQPVRTAYNCQQVATKHTTRKNAIVWRKGMVWFPDEIEGTRYCERFLGGYGIVGRTCGALSGLSMRTKQYGFNAG